MQAYILLLSFLSLTAETKGSGGVFTPKQETELVSFVDTLLQCRGIVGLTVAVAKGNETWTRGFGQADRASGRNVSTSDRFGIGSLTKAFTSALISLSINDTGRYSWQTPLVDILGDDFQFINRQLTEQVTLKDILTHRTGLDTTNLPFFAGSQMTRAQFAKRIRYLPDKRAFRDEFEYNNWMYGLAGHVTKVMGGASWEDLLTTRLLHPLNMTRTGVLGKTLSVQDPNFAQPYVLLRDEVVPSDPSIYSIRPQEAAGAIASSADDMAKWLLFHINKGVSTRGEQVINGTRMREMSTAYVSLTKDFKDHSDIWKPQFPVTFSSDGYGYAWFTASYRGYPVKWHSGGIYAYTSYIVFLPHLDMGIFLSNNGPGGSTNVTYMGQQIFFYVADVLLGEDPWLNITNACLFPQLWLNKSSAPPASNDTIYDDPDFRHPERYAGRYGHPLFGDIDVALNGSRGLDVQYGHLVGRLFRGEEEEGETVAMWQVLGSMEFMFLHGNKTVYLKLNFTQPSEDGVFQGLILSNPGRKEDLEFHREGSPGSISGGSSSSSSSIYGLKDAGVVVVVMMVVSVYLSLVSSASAVAAGR